MNHIQLNRIYDNFLEMLENPEVMKNYYTYYVGIVTWIKNNEKYFMKEILNRKRLDILMELNPSKYIVDDPGILLDLEFKRHSKNRPKAINTFAMILEDLLWDMVTIRSLKDCPNCITGDVRVLLVKYKSAQDEMLLLSCESCGWFDHINSIPWNCDDIIVMPANKEDLFRLGWNIELD